MHPILEKILSQGPVLTDGAWGTQLQARGLDSGECPDAWNLSHPDRVEAVARSYVAAGSRVILTNTFGANRVRLDGHGLGAQAAEINRAGVAISKRAAGTQAWVFASLGPCGKMLMSGDVTEEQLREAFTEQARAMAAAGADGIVVETMSELEEAQIAVAAARATGLPVAACLVFDSGKDKDRTMMGLTPEKAAAALAEAGADIVGANCGQGIAGYVAVCKRLRQGTDRPIWIKANAGLPEVIDGKVTYKTTPGIFAGYLPELLAAGAAFVGGCCGTSPEFIQALKARL